jgi:hypothetical protein
MKLSRIGLRRLIESVVNEEKTEKSYLPYTVKEGDTIDKLMKQTDAYKAGYTIKDVIEANKKGSEHHGVPAKPGFDPKKLQIGEKILVPSYY